jgi:hypothetical protein
MQPVLRSGRPHPTSAPSSLYQLFISVHRCSSVVKIAFDLFSALSASFAVNLFFLKSMKKKGAANAALLVKSNKV